MKHRLHSTSKLHEKTTFLYMAHLISAFVFARLPHLPKFKISSVYPFSVTVQPSLCRTWSETPKDRFSLVTAYMTLLFTGLRSPHPPQTYKQHTYLYRSPHPNSQLTEDLCLQNKFSICICEFYFFSQQPIPPLHVQSTVMLQ